MTFFKIQQMIGIAETIETKTAIEIVTEIVADGVVVEAQADINSII